MAQKVASADLNVFFQQELEANPNATLEAARQHLQNLNESAPGDSVARVNAWLLEINELIEIHGVHCPISDFQAEPGNSSATSPGSHG